MSTPFEWLGLNAKRVSDSNWDMWAIGSHPDYDAKKSEFIVDKGLGPPTREGGWADGQSANTKIDGEANDCLPALECRWAEGR
jgi:hypothetical protein